MVSISVLLVNFIKKIKVLNKTSFQKYNKNPWELTFVYSLFISKMSIELNQRN